VKVFDVDLPPSSSYELFHLFHGFEGPLLGTLRPKESDLTVEPLNGRYPRSSIAQPEIRHCPAPSRIGCFRRKTNPLVFSGSSITMRAELFLIPFDSSRPFSLFANAGSLGLPDISTFPLFQKNPVHFHSENPCDTPLIFGGSLTTGDYVANHLWGSMQALSDLDLGYILCKDEGLDDPSFDVVKISLDFCHLVYLYFELYFSW